MRGRWHLSYLHIASITFLFSSLSFSGTSLAAETHPGTVHTNLDHIWIIFAACLVFLMQVGFLMLESGFVRAKSAVNVAQKNLSDFILSTLIFGAVGFAIMFGKQGAHWYDIDFDLVMINTAPSWTLTFFVFQLMFCSTAATIISGATAERMKLEGYLVATLVTTGLIYPVFGHLAWGNLLYETNTPFLASIGFIDFAGSTVVHSTGAWVALAAVIILGPRIKRFDSAGHPQPIPGHSPVLAAQGCILLWLGWIGFNGGSTMSGSAEIAPIIVNTVIAGAVGGIVQMTLGKIESGFYKPERTVNGVLAGLVGITAGCASVSIWGALAISTVASVVAHYGERYLLERAKLDDAIGSISVHGFAGAIGTILVAVFALPENLIAGSRLDQLWVQCIGVSLCFVWAFGVSYILLSAFDHFWKKFPGGGIRVQPDDEVRGLNLATHGVNFGNAGLLQAVQKLSTQQADISPRLEIEPHDEDGEIAHMFNEVLDRFRSRDELTGLRNLKSLRAELDRIATQAHNKRMPLCIMNLDVDHLGKLNEDMGRNTGDNVLKEIARRLKQTIGSKGMVGRISGDEFLMIIPDAGEEDARDIANYLIEYCRQPFKISNKQFALSCSIGVALSPREAPVTGEELLLNADLARDAAKKEGKNQFRFYHPDMRSHTEALHQLGHELQQALTANELKIYYQPQWNLMTNQLSGAEALVRWDHPRLGILAPGQFLPAAEILGLLPKIDAYVFEHCVSQIVEMKQIGLDPKKVSINAESGILSMPGYADEILDTLKQAGISNGDITIEILENTLVIENQTILENIRTLLENSVSVALDDFGTGFSSLAQLKHLPVNILKIDRSIINNIENNTRDHSIMLSTINLAKGLQVDVVAEGVENIRQLHALKACGCKFVQGYLIAKPMPLDDYQRYIEEHTSAFAKPSPLIDAA